MTESKVPNLPKWPFYLADALLCGVAALIFSRMGTIEGGSDAALAAGCLVAVALGAWASLTPWLRQYDAQAAQAESAMLKDTLSQIEDLQAVGRQVQAANVSWQTVQDSASQIVTSCQTISQRMAAEAAGFRKFFENVNEQEKGALRLEVEKLRRMEGDWLQAVVRMMDHTHALHGAGMKSENPNLIAQLTQFQTHIRDAARRLGLNAFAPEPGDYFDERLHQPLDGSTPAGPDKRVDEIRAFGYTYQGQLIRKALVVIDAPAAPQALVSEPVARPSAPPPEPQEPAEPPAGDPDPQVAETESDPVSDPEPESDPAPGQIGASAVGEDIFEPLEQEAEPEIYAEDNLEGAGEAPPAKEPEPRAKPPGGSETEERQVKLPWGK